MGYHLGWSFLGVVLVAWTVVDVVATTHGEGGGFLNRRIGSGLWALALGAFRWHGSHRLLSLSGVAVILLAAAFWIGLLWLGWTLVFCGAEGVVVEARTQRPADFLERVYFTGFTIFTLGLGDFSPKGDVWRIATAVASFSGFFLVTFSITYLIPIAQAATDLRTLGLRLNVLGATPAEIVRFAWSGGDLERLDEELASLEEDLALFQQRFLTYPVLNYLHSSHPRASAVLGIAALDDALALVEHGLDTPKLDGGNARKVRRLVDNLLDTLSELFDASGEVPPAPDLAELRDAGLPVRSQEEFERGLEDRAGHRRDLCAMLRAHGWRWEEIASPERLSLGNGRRTPS